MQDTCNFEQCKFGKSFFNDRTECFNFIESWWTPHDGGPPKLVGDCAPRRTVLMIQEHYNRLEGIQKAVEEERNADQPLKQMARLLLQNVNIGGNDDHVLELPRQ